jgi:pimeloyl-ACP methyl ester carboxylesterase
LFPESLGKTVSGLILTHTTPVNPVRTTSGAAFLTAIEKPVLIPLLYFTIALSPLLRLLNWLTYLNGSAHLMNWISSFGGTPSWEKVEFATHFQPLAAPSVVARGMLAMMDYDARDILERIPIPTLVVTGDLDTTTKPEAGVEIDARIPRSTILELSPAKHLGLIEHDGEYAEAVRNHALRIALHAHTGEMSLR